MRMGIVDEEGAPVELGIRPFTQYAPYLIKEIIESNIAVTKIICSRQMPLQRNMIEVSANQKSELGRVILANSITLTPGTISVDMEGDKILVHALSFEGAEEDLRVNGSTDLQTGAVKLMFVVASIAILVTMTLALIRAMLGPTVLIACWR